jgi:uncharacterized protein (TIGR03435 family)
MTTWLPPALMNHLWQSTLSVLLVWLATWALRRNGARVRYWLWAAASIKFFLPLSMLVSLGENIQWREPASVVQPAVSFVLQDVLTPATVVTAVPVSALQPISVLPWILAALWVAGTTFVLMVWWRQWRPIRSALRDATPVTLDARYAADDLTVLSSRSMPEPGVVGIHRPRLLLPEGILDRLTPAQMRALIAHERSHIRCRDNLVAAFHMVVEAIFWFHPLVWWIERRLVDERERACDEAVLRAGCRPQDYAEGLLEVCRQSVGLRLACVAGVSGSTLRARVEGIMRSEIGRPLTIGRRVALAIVVAGALALPVAAGALQSQIVSPPAISFETASISSLKPIFDLPPATLAIESHSAKKTLSPQDGHVRTTGSLHLLIQAAYGLTRSQVEGGPPWVLTDRYKIEARAGNATPDDIRSMLQSLLAERFHLTLRREVRLLPVYELAVANEGLKIAAVKDGGCIPPNEVRWDLIDLEAPLFICGGGQRRVLSQNPETRPFPRWPRVVRIEMGSISMAGFIDWISGDLDRIVIDRTGFTAPFNVLLDFAPPSNPESRLPPYSGPTIFEAVHEQLGLSLVAAEAPVDVFVIERAERPAAN